LGSGNFGIVYSGVAKGEPAAIKKPIRNCEKETFKGVLSEVNVHCYIGKHPNVIRIIGAYTREVRMGNDISYCILKF